MLNIDTKVEVLSNGAFDDYRAYRRILFTAQKEQSLTGAISPDYSTELTFREIELSELTELQLQECERLYNNNRLRAKRLRHKIEKWSLLGFVYFVTMTFNDETLNNTSDVWRRKLVGYYLKDLGAMYCANIDFGGRFNREHYHAIICVENQLHGEFREHKGNMLFDTEEFKSWNDNRGFVCVQGPIQITEDAQNKNPLKVAKYISKSANHALKATTKQHRLVYSRGRCPWKEPLKEIQFDGFYTLTESDLEDLPFDVNEEDDEQ